MNANLGGETSFKLMIQSSYDKMSIKQDFTKIKLQGKEKKSEIKMPTVLFMYLQFSMPKQYITTNNNVIGLT